MRKLLKPLIVLFGPISLLFGCASYSISDCGVDASLVSEIEFCIKPKTPTNADYATCLRDLRLKITEDNMKKQGLLSQLKICNAKK